MSLTQGYDSAPYGIKELGSTYLTEMARELQQLQADPLGKFLPQREIMEKEVKVEWTEDNLRVTGVVKPGMPNKLNTFAKAQSFSFQAAYFRRGQFIDQDTINYLRAPGTMMQEYGMDLVQEQMQELLDQGNMMLSVLRAQLFLGGINYTDPETGVSIVANSGIPAGNLYTIGTTAPVAGSPQWHLTATATPVTDLQKIIFRARLEGKNTPTHMIMNGQLLQLLMMNKEIRSYIHPTAPTSLQVGASSLVQLGADGYPTRICGVEIVRCDTLYDDLDNTGALVRRYLWPVNKVVLFSANNPDLPGQILGNTFLTKGEHPNGHNGSTGVWVRTFMGDSLGGPTTAPGVGMQVGMAGLPVFKKPKWVHILTVSTNASDITGVTGSTKYVV